MSYYIKYIYIITIVKKLLYLSLISFLLFFPQHLRSLQEKEKFDLVIFPPV